MAVIEFELFNPALISEPVQFPDFSDPKDIEITQNLVALMWTAATDENLKREHGFTLGHLAAACQMIADRLLNPEENE
jgi:hypothetical protein